MKKILASAVISLGLLGQASIALADTHVSSDHNQMTVQHHKHVKIVRSTHHNKKDSRTLDRLTQY